MTNILESAPIINIKSLEAEVEAQYGERIYVKEMFDIDNSEIYSLCMMPEEEEIGELDGEFKMAYSILADYFEVSYDSPFVWFNEDMHKVVYY